MRTEGIAEQFRLHPKVTAEVDKGYRGLANEFPDQISAPPKKPKGDAPLGKQYAWREMRRRQSSERICVEHANAELRQWRPLQRSTVYTVFGSRAGLFDALGMDLLHRGGFIDMVREVLHPDAREGLRGGIRGNVLMYAAHRDVLRALFSMAQLDAEAVGGALGQHCRARLVLLRFTPARR